MSDASPSRLPHRVPDWLIAPDPTALGVHDPLFKALTVLFLALFAAVLASLALDA